MRAGTREGEHATEILDDVAELVAMDHGKYSCLARCAGDGNGRCGCADHASRQLQPKNNSRNPERRDSGLEVAPDGSLSVQDQGLSHSDLVSGLSKNCFDSSARHALTLRLTWSQSATPGPTSHWGVHADTQTTKEAQKWSTPQRTLAATRPF